MVGSEQSSVPRKTVLYLLQRAGLMQPDEVTPAQLNITSAGFQFLLQDVNSQLWVLLLQYLSMAEERNMELVEVLAFFFTVGSLELGRCYETADCLQRSCKCLKSCLTMDLSSGQTAIPNTFFLLA